MMIRMFLQLAGALLVSIVIGGCGQSKLPPEEKVIEVGVIMPLTGGAASLGKPCLNGVELAIDAFNQNSKAKTPVLRLNIEDDRAEPTASISSFQKLVAKKQIRLIIGPLTSGGTLAVAPLAERNHVVIISPGASAPSITGAGDYVFRVELSEEVGANQQAELAYSRLKYKSISLVYVNNEYGAGTARIFRDRFRQLGGTIITDEGFAPGTTDFRTILSKLQTSNEDAVFFVFQDDIVNFMKQRAELAIMTPVYTTPVFEDAGNLAKLGSLAEGVVFTHYGSFDANANSGPSLDFASSYANKFHNAPTYYSALGYDGMSVVLNALRNADFDQDKVTNLLYAVKDFPGVTGLLSIDKNGDVTKPVTLKTVRGGHFVAY